MHLVPETRSGKITYYKTHLPVWAEDPASIGLSSESVDELQTLVDEARQAYAEHQQAQMKAQAATANYHRLVRRMHAGDKEPGGAVGGAAMIQSIKTYAQVTGDPGVYTRASITPPARPGRAGSTPLPGTPYRFAATLRQTGEVVLTWKCDNPDGTVGTIYQVGRQIENGTFTLAGTVGEKKFIDYALPPGTKYCTYQVTALRSTGKGAPGEHTIQLGCAHPLPQMFRVRHRKLVA